MKVAVLGLNHKSAPVSVRERLAFNSDEAFDALKQLKERFGETEFAVLSTCNRVELYYANGKEEAPPLEEIIGFLGEYRGLAAEEFRDYLYVKHDSEAVSHLLTVSSSLDSMVVGESQIISQVKECFSTACAVKSTGKVLNKLFHVAFETSKAIYSDTSIANRRVSVAGVAVELAGQLFADVSSAKVVVIGAGEMGELLVEHFLHINCRDITIINRTFQRAIDLAEKHGVWSAKWEQMDEQLVGADIVVASAGGQDYLFRKKDFAERLKGRHKGSLLVIDIAVPRNFAPEVNEIDDVYVYSVDDLADVVEQNVKMRENEIDKAVEIILEKVSEYMEWLESMEIGPLVGQLKAGFEKIRENELEKFFTGDRSEANCQEAMKAMVGRVVNKLLHCVIINLNIEAKEHGSDHASKMAEDIIEQTNKILGDSSRD